ncbi:MAG TPA: cupin domain-containing protein [Polyangiaceae bacterium]
MCSQSSEVRKPPAPASSDPPSDPLSAVLFLLKPEPLFSGIGSSAGKWSVRYGQCEDFSFGLILSGQCFIEGYDFGVRFLAEGDFILLSQTAGFTLGSDLSMN